MSQSSVDTIPLLVADVFHLAGAFRRLGDSITGSVNRSQTHWQVLSVASDGPRTVPQIARRLGYARQSVQRTADQLVRGGLARYRSNPDHKASPLVELTPEGVRTLARIGKAAAKWHAAIAKDVDPRGLATTLQVVRRLREKVEEQI